MIGAPKAGTTSIYRYLESHPEVYLSPVKEPRYFAFPDVRPRFAGPGAQALNREIVWREEEYRALFAGRGPRHRAAGEASATYLWAPGTAGRIARATPDARLVAVLRQPVERAFSHFWHNRAAGREPITRFEDAVAAEPARRRKGWSFNLYYLERGLYGAQLSGYLEHFAREQLHVLRFEDFARDPRREMTGIAEHLGVATAFSFEPEVHNARRGRATHPRARKLITSPRLATSSLKHAIPGPVRRRIARRALATEHPVPLDPDLRARLTVRFEEDIRLTEALTGLDLSAWLHDPPA